MVAQTFELKTPYLKTGRSHNILAQTDLINVAIKYYYEGGENSLHTHPTEDHAFIVLDGEATFYDRAGNTTVLNKGKGILLPKGWFYRFHNSGGKPLVLLRFGADPDRPEVSRPGVTGNPLESRSRENNFVAAEPIEGSYWSL
ncbi:MAG TPA: cupin domain-containing protein [Candidatus Binatia bacterium]|jgi:mannose-6-phosphate isomerase-like protein (cupin superfamily)|nr:cupin domain-containing protein [Candidatus Binatia bacterium]